MSIAGQLVASGAFVALVPLGLVASRVLVTERARDVCALMLPLALLTMSIPLTIAAVLGRFDARWNGAFGWLVAIATAALVLSADWRPFRDRLRSAIATRGSVAILLVLAAVVYSLAVVETPIGGRDEGLYTLAGLALDRAGSVVLAAPDALAQRSGLFEPFVSGIRFHLPGIPAAETLKPQFSPLLPAWIAQLHGAGGDLLLYRFNVLATVACGTVFYALARRVLRRPLALLALGVFAFNPAAVWISRINLAEPLGALFALAGVLVALDVLRGGGAVRTGVAVGLLSLAAGARADMIVLAPLLTAAAIVCTMAVPGRASCTTLFRLSVWVLAGQSAAIALVAAWSPPYVFDHLHFLLPAPGASAAGSAVFLVLRAWRGDAGAPASVRSAAAAATGVMLVLLFFYAVFVRPSLEPFAVIAERGSALAGARDYREASLSNLAAYLGWPCIVLALCGALFALWRMARGRASAGVLLLTVMAIGTGVAYLAAPTVSPDHPWAIRRMVALVIPLFIVMAGTGTQALLHATVGWRYRMLPHAVMVAAVAWLLVSQRATLTFTENPGVTAQLRAIDAKLPPGPLVIRGFDGLATTFALGFRREVLPLRDEAIAVGAASRAFWASCSLRPCTLLHASFDGLDGLALAPSDPVQLSREYLAPTFQPLAHDHKRETLWWLTSRVSGISGEPAPRNAGAARDWRLDDRGFHRDELAPGIAVRWTNGDAQLTLPALKADWLEVRVASASRAAQPVRIGLDGVRLFEGMFEPGEARWRFPVDTPTAATHRLTLQSSSFVPGDSIDGADRRTLGLSVRAIRLLAGGAPPLTAVSPPNDFRSRLIVRPTALHPLDTTRASLAFRVDADNVGQAAWPARDDVAPQAASVALGFYVTRVADSQRVAEQRVQLPYSLMPGEHWTTSIVVDAATGALRQVPAGEYELHVGLVLEGIAWFADRGDRRVTIPLTIAAR